jgi:hypothetical protein
MVKDTYVVQRYKKVLFGKQKWQQDYQTQSQESTLYTVSSELR